VGNWIRLHDDMPNDPKWRSISRRSLRPVCEVIAVYVHMLINASAGFGKAEDRGSLRGWNDEDVGAALDMESESVTAIRTAMQGRVLAGDRLTGWKKRQPPREDASAERTKAWREKQKATPAVTHCDAGQRSGDGRERGVTARVDKRREDRDSSSSSVEASPRDALELLARLKQAAQGKIAFTDVTPIQALIADSDCDLDLDVLPAVAMKCAKMSRPLENPSAGFVVREIVGRANARRAAGQQGTMQCDIFDFASRSSPKWAQLAARYQSEKGKACPVTIEKRGQPCGWYFPQAWLEDAYDRAPPPAPPHNAGDL